MEIWESQIKRLENAKRLYKEGYDLLFGIGPNKDPADTSYSIVTFLREHDLSAAMEELQNVGVCTDECIGRLETLIRAFAEFKTENELGEN